jgi:hypothetical protein
MCRIYNGSMITPVTLVIALATVTSIVLMIKIENTQVIQIYLHLWPALVQSSTSIYYTYNLQVIP